MVNFTNYSDIFLKLATKLLNVHKDTNYSAIIASFRIFLSYKGPILGQNRTFLSHKTCVRLMPNSMTSWRAATLAIPSPQTDIRKNSVTSPFASRHQITKGFIKVKQKCDTCRTFAIKIPFIDHSACSEL